jgi:cellulase/cellobiase CelA1
VADLRGAFRPFVEAASESGPRLGVDDLADRARRRRARRRTRLAGVAAAAAAVAVVFTLTRPSEAPDETDQVSVSDSSATTATSTTAPSSSTTGVPDVTDPITADVPSSTTVPPTQPPASSEVETTTVPAGIGNDARLTSPTAGLVANSTTTSSWDTGYCLQITVENTGPSPVDWQLVFAAGGTIADKWNVTALEDGTGTITLTGEQFNRTLAPSATTSFGTCIDT